MDGTVVIGTELNTKGFDKEIAVLEDRLNDIQASLQMADDDKTLFSTREIKEMEAEAEKLGRKIDKLKEKQANLNKMDFSDLGKSTEKLTKKIVKWGLAIFGIRSAYNLIRSSLNTISNNDDKLKADIDYMKNVIAYTIEPIVRTIVNLAKQLLLYIGYIIKAWTGHDIFANVNNKLASANNQAKELKKTLTGFDEINTVGDNSTSGGASGLGSMSGLTDEDAPEWLKFIVANKDKLLAVVSGIVAGITAIKLGLKFIKGLGLGIALSGIIYSIEKIIDFLNDPTFDNFMGVLEGITTTIIGIGILFGNWPLAVGGAIALIIVEIVKHWDEIKEIFNKGLDWIGSIFLGALKGLFGDTLGKLLYTPFEAAIEFIKTLFDGLFGGIKKIIDGIILLFKGDFLGGIEKIFGGLFDILCAPFNALKEAVEKIFNGVLNFFIDIINGLIDAVNVLPFIHLEHIPKIGESVNRSSGGGGTTVTGSGGGFRGVEEGAIINNATSGVSSVSSNSSMTQLGNSIGENITLNANITNTMNGRVISREMQKVNFNDNFAYNR